eukprot:jgi/Mesen1/3482/ME000195S02633
MCATKATARAPALWLRYHLHRHCCHCHHHIV